MTDGKSELKPGRESEPLIQPRLSLRGAELPSHAGRLINMLCDDPTDPDMVEVEWFIEAARGRN